MNISFIDGQDLGHGASQIAAKWSHLIFLHCVDGPSCFSSMEKLIQEDYLLSPLEEKAYLQDTPDMDAKLKIHRLFLRGILECAMKSDDPSLIVRLFQAVPDETIERQFRKLSIVDTPPKHMLPDFCPKQTIEEINANIKDKYNNLQKKYAELVGKDILNRLNQLFLTTENFHSFALNILNDNADFVTRMAAETQAVLAETIDVGEKYTPPKNKI